jgi:DNA-binding beta-propeller fold protein YncE
MELKEEGGKEFIYAARPNSNEVIKIDLEGKNVWTINETMDAKVHKDQKGFKPCAVSVAPDGSIFIADGYGSNYVLKYDKNRKFVKAFGGPGAEEGKFNTCHGIGVDTRGEKPLVLVANRNNNRVEHWDMDGNFVKVIQKDLRMPAAVQFQGKYAVFPELQGRVTLIDDKGVLTQMGDNPDASQRANYGLPPEKWKDGICNSPHGASMDKNGDVIVAEWSSFGHLHKFKKAQ